MLGPLQFLLDPLPASGPTPPPPIPTPVIVPVNVGWPLNYQQVKAELALRLGDSTNVFWTDIELGLYINEGLRFFALCSGYWRDRATFQTTNRTAYYDIYQSLRPFLLFEDMSALTMIEYLQFHLLESTATQLQWQGTEMFTYQAIVNAINNRTNQFLGDTGCVVNHYLMSAATSRVSLDLKTIDVRHAAWWDGHYYNPLWRTDERALVASGSPTWTLNPGTPDSYSVMGPPPLQLQIAPPPSPVGALELLTVDSIVIDPLVSLFPTPDNLFDGIKWGALADLLGQDGIARDPARAAYCEQRYAQYVQLARVMPVVLNAEVDGSPLIPSTLQAADSEDYQWENRVGTPSNLILAAPNMVALSPVPDGVYSVTLDVVRSAPIPVGNGDPVQLTRELIDMVLDYAEHIALFKVAGAEWHATDRAFQNFINEALNMNQRLSASVRYALSAADQSERQKQGTPRRLNATGIGSLRGKNG